MLAFVFLDEYLLGRHWCQRKMHRGGRQESCLLLYRRSTWLDVVCADDAASSRSSPGSWGCGGVWAVGR